MEALSPEFAAAANSARAVPAADEGYLAQPEMRAFIQAALDVGWTLIAYEVDMRKWPPGIERLSHAGASWRDREQGENLAAEVRDLPDGAPVLVWCGNAHLARCAVDGWRPMALCFEEISGIAPFALDQAPSVHFGDRPGYAMPSVEAFGDELTERGGCAGFLSEDAPPGWQGIPADAYLLSDDNRLM
jgi:hypothetical protein